MKKIFTILVTAIMVSWEATSGLQAMEADTVRTQSINPNQVLVNLIQTKKWFEVENYYQQHKDSINNEFVKLWYLAETGYVFNHPDEAINAYEQLFDKNLLHMNTPTLMSLFGQPMLQLCADVQEYAKGEELSQKLKTFCEKDTVMQSDTRLSYIQGFTQAIERFKLFPKEYPKLTFIKNKVDSLSEIKLLPDHNKPSNAIFFNAKWNGINLRTIFDTGAAGSYIYNRAIAEKIGIKLNTADTIMLNYGTIHALSGVVDSLELGEFVIKNIPVAVNIEIADSADLAQVKCDSFMNSAFDIVLGIPIIRNLGVIEFDFTKNTMSFPQKTTPSDKQNLYIDNTGLRTLYMNMEICNANFLTYFDTGGEGGLSINTDFFEKYKQCIPTEAEVKQAGNFFGSCNETSISKRYEYKCPQIDIKINDQGITLINDCSVAKDKENDNKFGTTEGGFLGNAIFKYCKKATFDFDNMVFSMGK